MGALIGGLNLGTVLQPYSSYTHLLFLKLRFGKPLTHQNRRILDLLHIIPRLLSPLFIGFIVRIVQCSFYLSQNKKKLLSTFQQLCVLELPLIGYHHFHTNSPKTLGSAIQIQTRNNSFALALKYVHFIVAAKF